LLEWVVGRIKLEVLFIEILAKGINETYFGKLFQLLEEWINHYLYFEKSWMHVFKIITGYAEA
jgi:hypothetical protein